MRQLQEDQEEQVLQGLAPLDGVLPDAHPGAAVGEEGGEDSGLPQGQGPRHPAQYLGPEVVADRP